MRNASLLLSARNLETSVVYFIASLGYAAFYNCTVFYSIEELVLIQNNNHKEPYPIRREVVVER